MKLSIPITIFSALLLFCTTRGLAQQEELSDYEIQSNFKTEYQQFSNKIDTVTVADSARAIKESIQELDEKYRPHEELLDKALYPETYEEMMNELNQAATLAASRLQKMERQDDQLTTLQLRLLAYQEHVYELTREADSLKQAMQESIESEKQLSGMVRNYRRNLEERDQLVLDFIDSTVVAYQQIDMQAFRELQDMNSKARLNSDGNALQMIRDISAENLNILEENSSNLHLEDYMRMQTVQQRFEQMWNRLGTKIAAVYGGSDAGKLAREVEANIQKWDELLQERTFATLHDSLREKGVAISEFENAEEFNNSLNAYLDTVITESRDGTSEENYERFQAFRDFWNRVERQWSSYFTEAGIMTNTQLATISEKTDTWGEHAEPESNTMTYLLIITAVVAIVLGGLLIREKTKGNGKEKKKA
ncbi:hypothetical protein SAMN05443144_12919 [Fodinibius roseus]|uniref:Uncharacterized protein n=1 Tax=Fodinibius roseus TaxID=1194090 RepID=A0A1M5K1K7_9BACT|nr:hypothetical protein [Fodinibius roseus]SHG46631.1 hypothetical protein SAMN05443144_12919 [Fodinibius roseus]